MGEKDSQNKQQEKGGRCTLPTLPPPFFPSPKKTEITLGPAVQYFSNSWPGRGGRWIVSKYSSVQLFGKANSFLVGIMELATTAATLDPSYSFCSLLLKGKGKKGDVEKEVTPFAPCLLRLAGERGGGVGKK